ncbi:MAG: DUF3375 domain-containing protein [Halioglobus sp.]|jgi:hypothetical protein
MALDYEMLEALRQNHPAWRLLASQNAALMASFFQKVFIEHNIRVISQSDLVEALEDELFRLRSVLGEERFPRSAIDYLNDWAAPEKGWLRKFYRQNSDEVQFDLTAATERALTWLDSLQERGFVGTESRLLTLFDLLRQLSEGSDADPETRLQELKKRREEIDAEMSRVLRGDVTTLDDTALKDRFMQFNQQARELLADFREVEHNFRALDRRVRERIATWEGNKGELLADIMGERDAIADSDQGASFRAFWDFLMSPQRQEDFSERLDRVLALPVIEAMNPDRRTRRIHHDWLEAGEYTQRTVAQLSQQLRRFLDDQAWLENRRIMEILRSIEGKALALREHPVAMDGGAECMTMAEPTASIELPMERPLYQPPFRPHIQDIRLEPGDENLDASALYSQTVVDKAAIGHHIRKALQRESQVALRDLCEDRPLTQGLSELVAYLEMGRDAGGVDQFQMLFDEEQEDTISWQVEGEDRVRRVTMPRVIFLLPRERR